MTSINYTCTLDLDNPASDYDEPEIELPRFEFMLNQLQTAMALTKQGMRADGLFGRCHFRITCDGDVVEIVPLPMGVHGPMLPVLQLSLEAQGFDVSLISGRGVLVRGYRPLSPHIH